MRPCYRALYDVMRMERKAVVLGTPGVGKSTAFLYFIWRLLQETDRPSAIIYCPQQKAPATSYVVFEGALVYRAAVDRVQELQTMPDVLELFDGVCPQQFHSSCRTWLVSSPRKDVWGDWQKQTGAKRWYMPTFSLAELHRCREVAFPHVPPARLEMLHERWGGSARSTLRDSGVDEQEGLIQDAHSAAEHCDLKAALADVAASDGGGGKYSTSPHILFHLTTSPGGRRCFPVFASDYCRDVVVTKLAEKGKEAVRQFLAASEASSAMGSLRGHLFERLALSALFSADREWTLTALDGSLLTSTVRPGVRPSVIFTRIPELQDQWTANPLAVGRPRNSNWPTWDAVTQDGHTITFWQMTASAPTDHGLKGAGLLDAVPLVPSGYSVRFIFVLLPRAGLKVTDAAVRIKGDAPGWAADMPQFVLQMDLDEGIWAHATADAATSVRDGEEPEFAAGHKRRRPETTGTV